MCGECLCGYECLVVVSICALVSACMVVSACVEYLLIACLCGVGVCVVSDFVVVSA